MNAEQENWMRERLRGGIKIEKQYPCMYDSANGFGYKIMLVRGSKQFNVLVRCKQSREEQVAEISLTIGAISHYTSRDEENITNTRLIGEKLMLTPVNEKTQMLDPYYSITGILTLQ